MSTSDKNPTTPTTRRVESLRIDPHDGTKRILTMRLGGGLMEFVLDQADQEILLSGFGYGTPSGPRLSEDDAAQRIGEYAAQFVKAPQLLVVIVSSPGGYASYRSNIVGGNAAMPAMLRDLANKIPTVKT